MYISAIKNRYPSLKGERAKQSVILNQKTVFSCGVQSQFLNICNQKLLPEPENRTGETISNLKSIPFFIQI
jgi:hypothetical protein